MEKPKLPIEPKPSDYPDHHKPMKDMSFEECERLPFIRDYRKYQKDTEQYKKDIEVWEQLKFIKNIRSSRDEKILKKYKIIKR